MDNNFHYATVSTAINNLRAKGFDKNFTVKGDTLTCDEITLNVDDFEIVDIYRYEGNSDPADEAVVYAIASINGIKGVLVTGYGISADSPTSRLVAKLHNRI